MCYASIFVCMRSSAYCYDHDWAVNVFGHVLRVMRYSMHSPVRLYNYIPYRQAIYSDLGYRVQQVCSIYTMSYFDLRLIRTNGTYNSVCIG